MGIIRTDSKGSAVLVSFTARAARFALSAVAAYVLTGPNVALAKAPDCSYRNVYDTPDTPLADIPIYDQGNTDLCYAYTAAQLEEYYLRQSKQWSGPEHLHPLWISLVYKGGDAAGLRFYKNDLGNGHIHTAFRDLEDQGVCDPRTFDGELARLKRGVTLSDANFLLIYEGFWARRAKNATEDFHVALDGLMTDPTYRIVVEEKAGANLARSERADGSPSYEVPPAVEAELREVFLAVADVPLPALLHKEKVAYLRDTAFAACKGSAISHPRFATHRGFGSGFASNAKLERLIAERLDRAVAEPVGLGYCSSIYSDPDGPATKRLPLLPRIFRVLNNKNCSMHYSLVVGRRPNPEKANSCQYLVRNTAGRDFWSKRNECFCEKSDGTGYENCRYSAAKPHTDRVVGCWIDSEPLLNSAYDLALMEKPAE